ncbi:hypothetical protein SBRCBS47491_004264 [Sporothrix bragantina]|uniref:NADPH-dependent FMN reductase-like domain-containing protein n=1 Tax=Sporothrix bragantina TaxID=671064 RepID=A0ABP0BM13_9PEZI
MKILGLCGGSPGGNTELALTAALHAAQKAEPSATITLIRLCELSVGTSNISGQLPHPFAAESNKVASSGPDDRPWVVNHIMEADAILLGAPVMSRVTHWLVKWFQDTTLGPYQDVHAARSMIEKGKGDLVDQRIFKPRVAALLSLGGSLGSEWTTFGLPTLQQVFFPMAVKIVDQMEIHGAGLPGSVVLLDDHMARVEKLGRNLAEQAAKPAEERAYVGPSGLCPLCHLSVVAFTGGDKVDCGGCGAKGKAVLRDGAIALEFDQAGLDVSVVSPQGLVIHGNEIMATGSRLRKSMDRVPAKKDPLVRLSNQWLASPER